jgi:release factor glutamine methyltransferase
MNLMTAKAFLKEKLLHIYDAREASNIGSAVLEYVTGWNRIDRILNKNVELSEAQQSLLEESASALQKHKPLQYVLHEAWFARMRFYVNEQVLIPRPETEELVEWVNGELQHRSGGNIKLLDMGTGSGCIAISLKKKNPSLEVQAVDISSQALAVAERNARELKATVSFLQTDFLNRAEWKKITAADFIVSNPPYIPLYEKQSLASNVVLFEPGQALFVPDTNALIFYFALSEFAKQSGHAKPVIFVEIHEHFATETLQLFNTSGFETELRNDMQGKPRMIKATMLP